MIQEEKKELNTKCDALTKALKKFQQKNVASKVFEDLRNTEKETHQISIPGKILHQRRCERKVDISKRIQKYSSGQTISINHMLQVPPVAIVCNKCISPEVKVRCNLEGQCHTFIKDYLHLELPMHINGQAMLDIISNCGFFTKGMALILQKLNASIHGYKNDDLVLNDKMKFYDDKINEFFTKLKSNY